MRNYTTAVESYTVNFEIRMYLIVAFFILKKFQKVLHVGQYVWTEVVTFFNNTEIEMKTGIWTKS